jgi:hypothetical protein
LAPSRQGSERLKIKKGSMKDSVRFAVAFKCPNCGQAGARHWTEGNYAGHALGSNRVYSSVSEGFHCEEGRAANGEPVIVCDVCDEIQPD